LCRHEHSFAALLGKHQKKVSSYLATFLEKKKSQVFKSPLSLWERARVRGILALGTLSCILSSRGRKRGKRCVTQSLEWFPSRGVASYLVHWLLAPAFATVCSSSFQKHHERME
jgi:hypothetical protein